MKKFLKKSRDENPVVYPFLFALFPVIFLLGHNINEAPLSAAVLPVILIVFTTFVMFYGAALVFGNYHKAGLFISYFLLWFLSYGRLVAPNHIGNIIIRPFYGHIFLIVVSGIIPLTLIFLFNRYARVNFNSLTRILNVTAAALILATSLLGLAGQKNLADYDNWYEALNLVEKREKENVSPQLPDIYYIILDGYGGAESLKEFYDFPNDKFLSFLKEHNFYIADKSRSNYSDTMPSLLTSLNMTYYDDLPQNTSLTVQLRNNAVLNFLKQRGYETIHVGGGFWNPTRNNPYADESLNESAFQEFHFELIKVTFLRRFLKGIIAHDLRKTILNGFDLLEKIPETKKSKFVFAHFIVPHPPFVFDREGNPVSVIEILWKSDAWKRQKEYIDQLIYVNKLVEHAVQEILRKSERPPIIIIQGDHGPASHWRAQYSNIETMSEEEFERARDERSRILNAYYFPGGGPHNIYDTISPVNTFRLIFNHYFGQSFDLLRDVNYFNDQALESSKPDID